MPDIFISYAKADHALALELSAFLESEGWTVWWDKSLGAADLYRDEIMKQLAAARAVITIWTPNSIKSDWVRAEAGRAKAEGKLIPVKTSELTYADIPLPFGEMHTENISSPDLIRAAIVAQLAKPAVSQAPFWQITSTFKYEILTWIGIVGSAITLFVNLNGVLDFADRARELVKYWHEWSQMFWGWVFSLVKIQVPRELVPIISFAVFATILVVGVNLSQRTKHQTVISYSGAHVAKKIGIFVGGVLLYLVWIAVINVVLVDYHQSMGSFVYLLAESVASIGFPIAYLLYVTKERLLVLASSLLFVVIGIFLLVPPLLLQLQACAATQCDSVSLPIAVLASELVLFQILLMAVILFSPLQELTRRLTFVVVGVLTLLVLSEISKLNLHQYLQPLKVSDNSVR